MNNNMNEMMEFFEMEEGTNIKEFLFRLLSKWHWFVLCGFLGVALGFTISKYSKAVYDVQSVVLVEEESKGMGVENLFEGMDLGSKTNIQNHVGILKSYTINLQTLKNLDWNTTWYKEGTLVDTDLYKDAPFEIESPVGIMNPTGLHIYVTPENESTYAISAKGEAYSKGVLKEIEFSGSGQFGKLFENEYFSFTINKKKQNASGKYYFVFNDAEGMALDYVRRLNVGLVDKKSELIQLKIQGNTPARQVDYLNELTKVYMQFGLQQKNQTSLNTVRFIDEQLDGIVDSLKTAGKNFTDFRTKNKTIDLSKEAEMVSEKIGELDAQETALKLRLEYYKNLLTYMKDAENMNKIAAPSFMGIADAALNAQIVKLGELYARKSTLSHIAKEKNPSLILLNEEIKNAISVLEENVNNLLHNTQIEFKALKRKIDEVSMQLAALPETQQQMVNIKRSFDLNNELYTFLLKKRAEAAITTASNVSDARVLDPARVRTAKKVGPKTALNLMVGLILGLALPFLIIVIGDYFNDSIKSKEDIEKESKLPIMGEIAHNNYKSELAIVAHPRSGIAESFRGLRTNLQYMFKQQEDCKVLALHSMIPGEGKTFNSVNLATIIAMDSKKVLLVGCDLRKPRLHKIFNVNNKSGLSTYLIGSHSIKEIVHPTDIKNLSFVNSGPIPPNPAELLGTEEFAKFIEEAKNDFDYIVLDNAPVTLVTDGILTGKHADANLFVLRQGYSNKSQIKFINQVAEKESISQIGIVLNDAVYNGYGYGNNYGSYGYGNGYYDEDHANHNWRKRLLSKFSKN
ncbi:polysaccharide biosynthesis tyrosine autokinase [Marinifilum sp. D714]|uniref:GumC family protein n=1 Tax=Marinifilum sp. D714 TaxID=2937523 RepID=UPI0027CF5C02|nr:polysaccharide biosynthesis tyrosine autokinase [Marinifilum sp. D714]MDQ2178536.1 polysaccharide biosynthesis tyrosine autokinase [Marinifilum sp. D714]